MFSRIVGVEEVISFVPVAMVGKNTGCIFMFIDHHVGVCLHNPQSHRGYKVGQVVFNLIGVNDSDWTKFDGVIELSNNKIGH